MITFTVDGQPIPKARPRVITRNGSSHTHTPARTKAWELRVGWAARLAGAEPMTGDLAVVMHFRRKGHRRADLDNMVKAVLDGLNGIVYADDDQIVALWARVEYGCTAPGVTIDVEAV